VTAPLTSPDKVLWPGPGYTKRYLRDYLDAAGDRLLAHVRDRPLTLKRFPEGLDGEGFFQKNAGSHYPDWIRREQVPKRDGGSLDHVIVDEPATIVYLADQGTIEFHPWLSQADDLEHPVEVIFDLGPPPDAAVEVVRAATRHVQVLLHEVAAPARLKTTAG
jgi:bifunctional non-homologous end joining protein LigD